ncbi:unnamed protein product [Spodoptera exigua]|nr:unnamed protein product [Spodoptera exigua]
MTLPSAPIPPTPSQDSSLLLIALTLFGIIVLCQTLYIIYMKRQKFACSCRDISKRPPYPLPPEVYDYVDASEQGVTNNTFNIADERTPNPARKIPQALLVNLFRTIRWLVYSSTPYIIKSFMECLHKDDYQSLLTAAAVRDLGFKRLRLSMKGLHLKLVGSYHHHRKMFEQLKSVLDAISNANTNTPTDAGPKLKVYRKHSSSSPRGASDGIGCSRLRRVMRGKDRGDISKSTRFSRNHLSCAWRNNKCRDFYVFVVDPTELARRDLQSSSYRSEHCRERCYYYYADSETYCLEYDREFCSHLYEDCELTEDAVVAVTVSAIAATAVALLVNGPLLKDAAVLPERAATEKENTGKLRSSFPSHINCYKFSLD